MLACRLLRNILILVPCWSVATSVPWNTEIPRPPPPVIATSGDCQRTKSASLSTRVANVSAILELAAAYGISEAEKYSDTFGFFQSKYENLTWPRFRRRPDANLMEEVAFASQFATEFLADRLKLAPEAIFAELPCLDVLSTALGKICPEQLREFYVCPRKALSYRTYDGRCNNFNQPFWGAAFTPLLRLLPPRDIPDPHFNQWWSVAERSADQPSSDSGPEQSGSQGNTDADAMGTVS